MITDGSDIEKPVLLDLIYEKRPTWFLEYFSS